MKKRVLSLILAAGCMFSALSMPAAAELAPYPTYRNTERNYDSDEVVLFTGPVATDRIGSYTTATTREYITKSGIRLVSPLPVTEEQKQKFRTTQYAKDVPLDMWYAEGVNGCLDGGVFTLDENGNLRPNDPVTQAEFSVVLTRLLVDCDSDAKCGHPVGEHAVNWASDTVHEVRNRCSYYIQYELATTTNCVRGEVLCQLGKIAFTIFMATHEGSTTTVPMKYLLGNDPGYLSIPDLNYHCSKPLGKEFYDIHYGAIDSYIFFMYNLGYTEGIDAEHNCGVANEITRAELAVLLYRMGLLSENCVGSDARNTPKAFLGLGGG